MIIYCADHKKLMADMIWARISKLGPGSYQCAECGLVKSSSGLTALKNHVEHKHLANMASYSCHYCHKTMATANAYHQHLQTHKLK